jgi:DNA-binding transcriptional regulator YiaG
MSIKKPRKSRGTQSLLRSLEELEDCVRDGVSPQERFPSHTVFSVPNPKAYAPPAVIKLRKQLGLSQRAFADLLGVSRVLVQSWERGVRTPSRMACRLLDTINRDPAGWLAGLREVRRAG